MADFVKVADFLDRVAWVNRDNVTDVTYWKGENKTVIRFCGDRENYMEIKGGDFSHFLIGGGGEDG